MARIRHLFEDRSLPKLSLDIGCGTGLSSRALLDISQSVVALDCSPEMLALLPRDARIHRVLAESEQMPLRSEAVDLITASCVIHWLNLDAFMSEARRVLRPGGPLVVYDNYFMADQPEMPGFKQWFEEQYLKRFPSPKRNRVSMDSAAVWGAHGFALTKYEWYDHDQTYSAVRFIDYLLTQSNVISAVENGRDDLDSVRTWLSDSLAPFLHGAPERRFRYSGPIAILHAV